jgi:hypothetical protein
VNLRTTEIGWYRPWLDSHGDSWVTVGERQRPAKCIAVLTFSEWIDVSRPVVELPVPADFHLYQETEHARTE